MLSKITVFAPREITWRGSKQFFREKRCTRGGTMVLRKSHASRTIAES